MVNFTVGAIRLIIRQVVMVVRIKKGGSTMGKRVKKVLSNVARNLIAMCVASLAGALLPRVHCVCFCD
jgi:hypothetical protein